MQRKNGRAPKRNACIDTGMFVVFCLVFSPAMLYLGFSSLYDDYELADRGATLEASVTDAKVEMVSGHEAYSVKYRFTLDGGKTWYSCADRTGRRDLCCGITPDQWPLTQQTKRVAVIYLPGRPWTNHPVHTTISTGDALVGVLLGIGPWAALLLILLSNWRNEAQADQPAEIAPCAVLSSPPVNRAQKGGPMSRYPVSEAAKGWVRRADQSYGAADRRAAIRAYSEALKLEPDCVYALVQRGLALQEERRLTEALADYNRAIQLDPNYGPAYYGRGWARHWQKDYAGELKDAQRGNQLDPRNPGMYLRRAGAALSGLKQYAEALQAYSKALELNPTDEGTLLNRAVCYLETGHYQSALEDINRALELDPDWDWAFFHRGQIYERMGETDLAARDYQRALHHNPGYKPASEALQRLRHQQGSAGLSGFVRSLFGDRD